MKLVNERGKLFGIINLVDFVLLLAIVLAIAAVGYKTLNKPIGALVAEPQEATITLRVRGAMPYLVSEILKDATEGTQLVSGSDFVDATVVNSAAVPYVYSTVLPDGRGVEVTDPTKQDVLITIKAKGYEKDPILKIGSQEVRIGRGYTFKTNRLEIESIVETVSFHG